MQGTYSYNPACLGEYGKDRMRFELGDTMVGGGQDTCALCDEEYGALIPEGGMPGRQWKLAKLQCLESIMRRFAYEPDTVVGPLSLKLGDRAKLWKDMYDALKKELSAGAAAGDLILALSANPDTGQATRPYFYNGMMSHEETEGQDI
jgi:hypothetical protein